MCTAGTVWTRLEPSGSNGRVRLHGQMIPGQRSVHQDDDAVTGTSLGSTRTLVLEQLLPVAIP